MKLTHLFLVCTLALAFRLSKAESQFQICADTLVKGDNNLLCKIRNLEVDGNMPKAKDFMNCAFEASGWTDKGGQNFKISKLAEDMNAYGYNKQKEVDQVIKECKAEFGALISAIDYLACLLIDESTKKEFKMTLMVKEADFFKQNFCK